MDESTQGSAEVDRLRSLDPVEEERKAHLRFFEAMDRVNRAIQGTHDLEQTMRDVLDVVLAILDCDRAWLVYPCDPATPTFRVPMERCRPAYAATSAVGLDVPVVPDISALLATLRATDGPVTFGPGSRHPLPVGMAQAFHIRSQMVTAVHPKVGQPYAFGIHQCSRERIWTAEEVRLFQEVGRRLADALTTLLIHRDLQESERRYHLAFESSPVPIWEEDFSAVKAFLDGLRARGVVDLEAWLRAHPQAVHEAAALARVQDVNQAALAMHGATSKGELLAGLANVFTPESFEMFRQELVCLWQGDTRIVGDAVVKTLAGEARNATVYFSVCPGFEQSLSKVVVSLVDITDKLKLEAQLRQVHKMEAIGTLAGGVAHDFNNILSAILGYADLARTSLASDDPQAEAIDHILASARRGARLTKGLLAFSRRQVLRPRPVDVNHVVRGIETLLTRLIGEDVELVTRVAPQPLVVMADVGQLEQVLMNLATNARDAMPDGGRLTISTSAQGVDDAGVDGPARDPAKPCAAITVSDTGAGLDPENREKIFEPFFTTKELGKGTGLGLSIVYGIVKQHDGNISVHSEHGAGTTFQVTLPLVEVTAVEAEPARPARPSGGTETLLLAEDDPDVRALNRHVFERAGYRVIVAEDGDAALALYNEHADAIDLVVLDVIMPKRSGKDVSDVIKAARPDLPVLFVSGYAADVVQEKPGSGEGVEFLAKPVTGYDLLNKVREMLDARRC